MSPAAVPGADDQEGRATAPTVVALGRNPFDRFVAWLRPDRRDPYLRERGRRLDRIDLAVVVGLVLFAFLFRLWRLDTPARHALRRGLPRSIGDRVAGRLAGGLDARHL